MANEHAGSVEKVDAPGQSTQTPQTKQAPKSVDNDAQAALAELQREFTTGGGADDSPTPEALAVARVEALGRAAGRVRAPDRPSPFGVAQFPPLPAPPERRKG